MSEVIKNGICPYSRFLFVGCGNMGGAMLAGWLAAGVMPSRFLIVDPYLASPPAGVELLRELPSEQFDAVLLGIKPQGLAEAAPNLRAVIGENTIVFSVLAGVEVETLSGLFPQAKAFVRIMPNLAAALGKSPVALFSQGLDEAERDAALNWMKPLGVPEWLSAESLFDAVTALAGSGPAFLYRFIASLADGAEALGLPADQAERLAVATVEGASALAAVSDAGPAELARRVASPGGTTQAGLDVMDRDGALLKVVSDTLKAASDRSAEMAAAARKA